MNRRNVPTRIPRRPLNCSITPTAAEQLATKIQLKEWVTRFFEENNIFPDLDFASWKINLSANTDNEYFAQLFVYIDTDTSVFSAVSTGAKFMIGDTSALAEAAKTMVDYVLADLANELENLIAEQIGFRIEDNFDFFPIDVTVHLPGNTGSEWSADVVIEGLESAKTTEPTTFDAALEFVLIPQSIMTSIADCADYIRYQY